MIHTGENITDLCSEILVHAERLDSNGYFNTKHIGYITRIFEDNSDSTFCFWALHKYNEVTYFIKKTFVCDEDFLQSEEIVTYESLV